MGGMEGVEGDDLSGTYDTIGVTGRSLEVRQNFNDIEDAIADAAAYVQTWAHNSNFKQKKK